MGDGKHPNVRYERSGFRILHSESDIGCVQMNNGSYEKMSPKERPHRPNTVRSDVNIITTFFDYLMESNGEVSWEGK